MEAPPTKPRIVRARALRADQTDAERKLWSALCNRQLEGFKFRRQLPIDRYFADFACVEAKLVVELDGSQHIDQAAYDAERTRVLEACGWRVLRFWNNDVLENVDGVGVTILAELRLLGP
ncbi:MAG: endonuclease domain-containing protein [Caulobacteraceae bacterium]